MFSGINDSEEAINTSFQEREERLGDLSDLIKVLEKIIKGELVEGLPNNFYELDLNTQIIMLKEIIFCRDDIHVYCWCTMRKLHDNKN